MLYAYALTNTHCVWQKQGIKDSSEMKSHSLLDGVNKSHVLSPMMEREWESAAVAMLLRGSIMLRDEGTDYG